MIKLNAWVNKYINRRNAWHFVIASLVSGCATVPDADKIAAIRAVNDTFRVEYEKILIENGTRVFNTRYDEAFVAMRVAMASIRMRTENQDQALGHLVVVAPAPLPLNDAEWRSASDADLPLLRKTIEPYVGGFAATFVQFEPQGLDVVISATFVEVRAGTEISLTARLREISPPNSGWPRREYLSPRIVKAGIDKIWTVFEHELRAGPKKN